MADHTDNGDMEILSCTAQEHANEVSAYILAITSVLITSGLIPEDEFNKVLTLCKHKVEQEMARKKELLRKAHPASQLFTDLFGGE